MDISKRKEAQQFREEKLGFKPQSEIVHNSNLPYAAHHIDNESNFALSAIKTNLSTAVLRKDIQQGVTFWAYQLTKYIRLYGFKFSKEDHVLFVKLLFEVITMPDVDSVLVLKICDSLENLLKKRRLLSRSDLQLDWVALHKLHERFVYSKMESKKLVRIPSSMNEKLCSLITTCNLYFPPQCTQDMLNEWKPLFCPFSFAMTRAVKYFDVFLPTLAFNEAERRVSWKLWSDEFLGLWTSVKNSSCCEGNFINLFARLAHNNVGHIDWSNYVKPLFATIHCTLNLHFDFLQQQLASKNKISFKMLCIWLVSMMGKHLTKIILQNLKCLLKGAETFFHPFNTGKWTENLFCFIQDITSCFTDRIFRERHLKDDWKPAIPEPYLLKDEDIEEFVEILKPVVLLMLYNEESSGVTIAAEALKHLAHLRPDLTLPSILDKSYIALSTDTEPHQVTACLSALTSVISPGICRYFDTKRHIFSLLFQCLPALDPNDLPKSTLAFQFIKTCIARIPLIDCSEMTKYQPNLNESEKEVYALTTQFEDFALQYFDRCFVLLEALNHVNESQSSSNVNSQITSVERASCNSLVDSCGVVLYQASESIYELCLKKLFWFSTTHLLEGNIALGVAAEIFALATQVNPSKGFALFIPHYCNAIEHYFAENTDAKHFEKVDKQLLWHFTILYGLCSAGTEHLLKYKHTLFTVAQNGLQMVAKEAYEISASIIAFCIHGWSSYYTADRKSWNQFDCNLHSFSVADWGATMSPWNVKIKWHVPSEEEYKACFEAINEFLEPAIKQLCDFNDGSVDLTKGELKRVLTIIKDLLNECYVFSSFKYSNLTPQNAITSAVLLRSWPIQTVETLPFFDSTLSKDNRRNLHAKAFDVIHACLEKILQTREDDVDAVCLIIEIYKGCFFKDRQLQSELPQAWKNFADERSAMQNVFSTDKKTCRTVHVNRAAFQQQMRLTESLSHPFMLDEIILDLLNLSTSHYAKVRSNAQDCFINGTELYHGATYQKYLPLILKHLGKQGQDEINHRAFKGAIHLVFGIIDGPIFLKGNQKWDAISRIWLSVVNSPHSDKQSIKELFELLAFTIQSNFVTISVQNEITDEAMQSALNLLTSQSVPSVEKVDTSGILEQGRQFNKNFNQSNLDTYNDLADSLVSIYKSGNLAWKHSELVLQMLLLMLRHDVPIPAALSTLFISLLVDDSEKVRDLAITSIVAITKQQKREHVVEMLSVQTLMTSVVAKSAKMNSGGLQMDDTWLLYDEDDLPNTEEKYNAMKFVDKTFWGYYSWPKQLKTYASFEQQPKLDRSRKELSLGEVFAFDKFTNPDFVEQLVTFLCVEKENGKFDSKKRDMFYGLFRNFGDTFVPYFKPHILRLVAEKRESHQRCAAEMITGLVMGSKHWPYAKLSSLWNWLIPALQTALSHICQETIDDWSTAFHDMVQNRDPRRIYWLLTFLVCEPTYASNTLLVEISKLHILQHSIGQQGWRVPQLLQKMLKHVESLLDCPYDQLRHTMGEVLQVVFRFDIHINGKPSSGSRLPAIDEFIQRLLTRVNGLQKLSVSNAESQINLEGLSLQHPPPDAVHPSSDPKALQVAHESTKNTATRIFKAAMKWIVYSHCDFQQFKSSFLSLLPLICNMYPVNNLTSDDELTKDTRFGLSCIAGHVVADEDVKLALDTAKCIATNSSWQTRYALLSYIQLFAFVNLFSIRSCEDATAALQKIILDLLHDEQHEVCKMASATLCGLIQCRAIPLSEDLLKHARTLCSTKLKKKDKIVSNNRDAKFPDEDMAKRMHQRHAGILILSACVLSAPYSVPDWMPKLVLLLSEHVNDPQPIRGTVQKTLDGFRRTHRDNWHEDQNKFTSDELAVLTDVLVSPSYYA